MWNVLFFFLSTTSVYMYINMCPLVLGLNCNCANNFRFFCPIIIQVVKVSLGCSLGCKQKGMRKMFSLPTTSKCKKFTNLVTVAKLWVSPPLNPHSQNYKVPFVGPRQLPKLWGKKAKATTKVAIRATQKIRFSLQKSQIGLHGILSSTKQVHFHHVPRKINKRLFFACLSCLEAELSDV